MSSTMLHLNVLVLSAFIGVAGCESRQEAHRKQAAASNLKQVQMALDAYHAKRAPAANADESNASRKAPVAAAADAEASDRPAENTIKASGEIAEFHRSPEGEVDGLTMTDGTEVRFPPKAGEQVAARASVGDQVELVGWTHAGESEIHAATITVVDRGKSVDVDMPPPVSAE